MAKMLADLKLTEGASGRTGEGSDELRSMEYDTKEHAEEADPALIGDLLALMGA